MSQKKLLTNINILLNDKSHILLMYAAHLGFVFVRLKILKTLNDPFRNAGNSLGKYALFKEGRCRVCLSGRCLPHGDVSVGRLDYNFSVYDACSLMIRVVVLRMTGSVSRLNALRTRCA